ncbi:MAG TPA: type IV toxin-antitoxin system AbiEi family antitoxin domain-containing protein [Solirubrobacteraceae bacterium]|nr:type IV toxin-antitoxin system AbiEi family antitoxin domain-containing protein [Solirubrobacteraceae bacterium]
MDVEIAALATRQHGVVARRQLRELGLSDGAIANRVAAGRLHRLHHGVYALGHAVLGARGRWSAAVLAAGPNAFLSHAAAGALWELRASAAVIVDVTIVGGGSRKRAGLRIHRARDLTGQITMHEGIPVTTPARTTLDLAATLQRRPLERLLDQAENTRLTDVASLDALARAHTGHRGAPRLLATLDTHAPGTTITKSELEERFLALCDHSGLPRPRVNAWVEGLEVDFLFPQQRLIVETDGYRFHHTREQFERDRHRDATLTRAGYRTLRFSHTQLTHEPTTAVATLRAAYRGASTH